MADPTPSTTCFGDVSLEIMMAPKLPFVMNINDRLLDGQKYYYSVSIEDEDELPAPNLYAALDNPLKGLMGSPWFGDSYDYNNPIPSTLEWFYIGLNGIMFGDPDVVGVDAAFNWTDLDSRLEQIASRHKHAAFTTVVHYPGWEGLAVPQYLLDAGLSLQPMGGDYLGSDVSPNYGDPMLLRSMEQYISALGARYDADPRIGFINLGLLGYWGEWHTYPHDWVPLSSWESVVRWYAAAFNTTKLHVRYPYQPAYDAVFGLYDGSFTTETLDGEHNAGVESDSYFQGDVINQGQEDFWRRAPMAGETRNENQGAVFKSDYVPGYMQQDFMQCVNLTHATYILHNHAFEIFYTYEGEELSNALAAHVGMGYNFIVSKVSVAVSPENSDTVDIDVIMTQIGVAPFYYDLNLVLDCPDLLIPQSQEGVESIIAEGDVETFSFLGVPSTITCLSHIALRLASSYAYDERPVKFSQGIDGTNLTLMIPTPIGLVENIDIDAAGGFDIGVTGTSEEDTSKAGLGVIFVLISVAVCLAITVTLVSAWFKSRRSEPVSNPPRKDQYPSGNRLRAPTDYSSYSPSSVPSPTKDIHRSFFTKSQSKYFQAVPE